MMTLQVHYQEVQRETPQFTFLHSPPAIIDLFIVYASHHAYHTSAPLEYNPLQGKHFVLFPVVSLGPDP